MSSRRPPHISRAAIAGARALLASPAGLAAAAAEMSCSPGYDGCWDIDHQSFGAGLLAASRLVPKARAILADAQFLEQLECRVPKTEQPGSPFDDGPDEWGGWHTVEPSDLADGLRSTIEVCERAGWITTA